MPPPVGADSLQSRKPEVPSGEVKAYGTLGRPSPSPL